MVTFMHIVTVSIFIACASFPILADPLIKQINATDVAKISNQIAKNVNNGSTPIKVDISTVDKKEPVNKTETNDSVIVIPQIKINTLPPKVNNGNKTAGVAPQPTPVINVTTIAPPPTDPPTPPPKPTTKPTTKPTDAPITTTIIPPPTTLNPNPSTTTHPPQKGRHFDGPSFIGGIILAMGLMAIGFISFKFYKARTERNYHTL